MNFMYPYHIQMSVQFVLATMLHDARVLFLRNAISVAERLQNPKSKQIQMGFEKNNLHVEKVLKRALTAILHQDVNDTFSTSQISGELLHGQPVFFR